MRITGGFLGGRKIIPPQSIATRPMMDRVRQALFNILLHRDWGKAIGNVVEGADVLDAFCGTGALALEALSHGGKHATLFDKDPKAQNVAKQNITALGVADRCTLMAADTLQPPKATHACKLVFLAPPYRKGLIPPALLALDQAGWVAKDVLIVAETAKKEELPLPDGYAVQLERSYGDTVLYFITRVPQQP